MVALGVWRVAIDLGRPYRTPWDRTAREFARWFWEEQGADAELVCVRTDLGIPFRPERWSYDATDQYLCYQRIYSPRHRLGQPPRWDAVSRGHPLRCVLLNQSPQDVPAFCAWLEARKHRYVLVNVRSYLATRARLPGEPRRLTSSGRAGAGSSPVPCRGHGAEVNGRGDDPFEEAPTSTPRSGQALHGAPDPACRRASLRAFRKTSPSFRGAITIFIRSPELLTTSMTSPVNDT